LRYLGDKPQKAQKKKIKHKQIEDKEYLTDLTYKINGACIEVHKILGSGLLESVYHKCLEEELRIRNIGFKSELII